MATNALLGEGESQKSRTIGNCTDEYDYEVPSTVFSGLDFSDC